MLRDRVLAVLREFFAHHGQGFVAGYLFGSIARSDDGPASDVDVGVLLGRPRGAVGLAELDRTAELQQAIAQRLGRDVDLVLLDLAAPDLQMRVLRDGVLLFETDRAKRTEFEIHVRNECFDLLPYLVRYRATVLGRA